MNKAKFKGKIRDKYSPSVTLFYEYRGREYMVTDEHNGYSEPMWLKHKIEQERIDRAIEADKQPEKPYRYEDSADHGFDLLWKYFEFGEWDEDEQEKT